MFALLIPLAGGPTVSKRFRHWWKHRHAPLGFPLYFARVIPGGNGFAGLHPSLACIAEADFGIDSQCQQFFPACKVVF